MRRAYVSLRRYLLRCGAIAMINGLLLLCAAESWSQDQGSTSTSGQETAPPLRVYWPGIPAETKAAMQRMWTVPPIWLVEVDDAYTADVRVEASVEHAPKRAEKVPRGEVSQAWRAQLVMIERRESVRTERAFTNLSNQTHAHEALARGIVSILEAIRAAVSATPTNTDVDAGSLDAALAESGRDVSPLMNVLDGGLPANPLKTVEPVATAIAPGAPAPQAETLRMHASGGASVALIGTDRPGVGPWVSLSLVTRTPAQWTLGINAGLLISLRSETDVPGIGVRYMQVPLRIRGLGRILDADQFQLQVGVETGVDLFSVGARSRDARVDTRNGDSFAHPVIGAVGLLRLQLLSWLAVDMTPALVLDLTPRSFRVISPDESARDDISRDTGRELLGTGRLRTSLQLGLNLSWPLGEGRARKGKE
jgi:hypothetical protein